MTALLETTHRAIDPRALDAVFREARTAYGFTDEPVTDRELARLTLRYPLVTLRVITLIHWQALRLWWRGVPWHRKAARTDLQRGVFRPGARSWSSPTPTGTDGDGVQIPG